MSSTFIREFEIELISETLKLYQKCEDDVSCAKWDAAIVLAKYLEETSKNRKQWLQGLNIVALGAGIGCAGLTAACMGGNVLLTDLPEVLALLELNVKKNERALSSHGGIATVKPLRWGENVSFPFKPELVLLDNCIYYKQSVKKLVETLEWLTDPRTRILLSQEIRKSHKQKQCWDDFVKIARKRFSFRYIPLSEQNAEYWCPGIKLVELQRK